MSVDSTLAALVASTALDSDTLDAITEGCREDFAALTRAFSLGAHAARWPSPHPQADRCQAQGSAARRHSLPGNEHFNWEAPSDKQPTEPGVRAFSDCGTAVCPGSERAACNPRSSSSTGFTEGFRQSLQGILRDLASAWTFEEPQDTGAPRDLCDYMLVQGELLGSAADDAAASPGRKCVKGD